MPTPERMQQVPKHGRDCLHDCVFLTLLVLVSFIPYVGRLGFYTDDWGVLAKFLGSHDQTVLSLFRLLRYPYRPVETLYFTLQYKLFGLHPLGYHIMTA